jgi:class 3 adenylate cyclase
MALKDELYDACRAIYASQWEVTNKYVVPAPTDLRLGNHAGYFEQMTVLYADLNGSTNMVDKMIWEFSAEVYKAYLHCSAKIIKANDGVITAYDGDRIMAVFTGNGMESKAVRAAMKINYAIGHIVNPAMKPTYNTDFVVKHSIGIDKSPIRVARIGVKNDNDLVWVGRAANHAAKLTNIPIPELPIWISHDVFVGLDKNLITFPNGSNVWDVRKWTQMNEQLVYGTNAIIAFN